MANNITDGGTFNTANMSPEADEETAALWAQNVADNTAFNFFEPKVISTNSIPIKYLKGHSGTFYGTNIFNNSIGYNNIRGTITLDASEVTANSAVFASESRLQVFIDGTSIASNFSITDATAQLHHFEGTGVNHDSSVYTHNQPIELGWRLETKDTSGNTAGMQTGMVASFSLYGTNV